MSSSPKAAGTQLRPAWRLPAALLSVWAVLATRSYFTYAGNLLVLTGFHLAFLAMLVLLAPRPRVDAYSFLAIFLFLGFWLKFTAHQWVAYAFVEPVGAFGGQAWQWDHALAAAAAAASGVSLCRVIHLSWPRVREADRAASLHVPGWYCRAHAHLWAGLAALTVLLYAMNFRCAFFVTGINARLVLPLKLNAVLAWALYCGIAMLCMLLADLEYQRRQERLWPLILSLAVLGIVMSASMLSRASTLFLFCALGMACLAHRRIPLTRFSRRRGWLWLLAMAGAIVVSLALVSAARLHLYRMPAPPVPTLPLSLSPSDNLSPALPLAASPSASQGAISGITPNPLAPEFVAPRRRARVQHLQMTPGRMLRQVLLLTTDRWIGLEGMLALSASHQLGPALLQAGLAENPDAGVDSIYQHLAHSIYVYQPGFTYLTLPGCPVVLDYSCSLLIVAVGMFGACAVICLIDGLAWRLTRSRLLTAWLGLLLANAICEMSFPYLTILFVGLSVLSLIVLRVATVAMAGKVEAAAQHA
jgi:hypothetical protein